MAPLRYERNGLLVVRVSLPAEQGTDGTPRLVARITSTLDLTTRQEAQAAASSVEELMSAIRAWVETFVATG